MASMGKIQQSYLLSARAIALLLLGCSGARSSDDAPPRSVQIAAPEPEPRPPQVAAAEPPRVAPEPEVTPKPPAEADELTAADRRAMLEEVYNSPRHFPELLKEPPLKSRIKPGRYRCRVSEGYKLRGCKVEKDPTGHVMLHVEDGNLIGMRGVLQNRGAAVRFEGWLTERRPFGCTGCQDRCYIHPGSCHCIPIGFGAIRECLAQPLVIEFRGGGGNWRGKLPYKTYFNRYDHSTEPPTAIGYEHEQEAYEVVLRRKQE